LVLFPITLCKVIGTKSLLYLIYYRTNEKLIAKLHTLNWGLLNDFYQAEGNTKDNENDVAEDILDFILTLITL